MARTGHKSVSSLHTYQRVGAKEKESVSDILQGNQDSFLNEPEAKKPKVESSGPERNSSVYNFSNCAVLFKM